MIKKTTCRKKNQESIFLQLRNILMLFHPAAHTANTITKKTSPWNYTGEDLFPMLVYLSKLFYLADLSAACFILFFAASPNSIWLPFHCSLSVTIIILLIGPRTSEDILAARSYITELKGLAVTKKASSLFEISRTSIAKSVLPPTKAAFHILW